jgi:hypothetical protein
MNGFCFRFPVLVRSGTRGAIKHWVALGGKLSDFQQIQKKSDEEKREGVQRPSRFDFVLFYFFF